MKRRTRFLLGLASVGGAVAGAGALHNRRPDRRERLLVTIFSEPGYTGRNKTLTWTGRGREIVPLSQVQLPRVGSIRLYRHVYRFQPEVRPPNPFILWHAITERPDRTDPEGGIFSFIAIHQLAGMFSVGSWEPVSDTEARSRLRLWAERPRSPHPAPDGAGRSGNAADENSRPWHDIVANTPDLASWSTRTRFLELGYRDGSESRG